MVARLEQLIARANDTATAQRNGMIQVRAARRGRGARRAMLEVPIAHLAEVGRAAAREEHELGKTFRFRPGASTYLAFRTAARGMAARPRSTGRPCQVRSLAVGAGRVREKLDQFEEAVALGHEGRAAHVGATRELGRWQRRSSGPCG